MQPLKDRATKALRWSEKYTKTDMSYLTSSGFWVITGQVSSALIGFVLLIILTNLLSKEALGTYRFILSVVAILAISSLPGMNTAVVQAVAKNISGAPWKAVLERIKWSFLGATASLCIAAYYFINGNEVLSTSFFIVAIFFPVLESFSVFYGYLQGKKNFRSHAISEVVIQLLSASALIAISILYTSNIPLLVFSYVASISLLRALVYFTVVPKEPVDTSRTPEVVRYGKHLGVMGVLGLIASNVDKILVWHFLGAAEVAIYVIAVAIPEHIRNLLNSSGVIANPKFAEAEEKDMRTTLHALWRKLGLFLLLVIFVIALYITFAPWILSIFFPDYPEATFYSQLFALSLLGTLAAVPMGLLQARQRIKDLYTQNTVSPLVHIGLMFVLIPMYGIWGAVIAKIIGRVINLGMVLYLINAAYGKEKTPTLN